MKLLTMVAEKKKIKNIIRMLLLLLFEQKELRP